MSEAIDDPRVRQVTKKVSELLTSLYGQKCGVLLVYVYDDPSGSQRIETVSNLPAPSAQRVLIETLKKMELPPDERWPAKT
jgi:hypothetical protein